MRADALMAGTVKLTCPDQITAKSAKSEAHPAWAAKFDSGLRPGQLIAVTSWFRK